MLEDHGFPHPSQTAYIKDRSCIDGIFLTNEVMLKLLQNGDSPYLCLYDLEKAFDSVEYNILFHHLYLAGINGKVWRLIRSWYTNLTCAVRFNGDISNSFSLQRGVKQGAVLSPILFCLVMSKLGADMDNRSNDLTISNINVGCASRADDIRTCNIGETNVQDQAACINTFTSNNSLSLNNSKLFAYPVVHGHQSLSTFWAT